MKKIVLKVLKIVGWVLASILFLVILVVILIQFPSVQNFAKDKAVAYLEKKIGTKVEVDDLRISFPKRIVLKGIYFEDQNHDTLLAAKEIRVDIALFGLIQKEVNVSYIELDGIRANIYKIAPDTNFNYEYIVKAFSTEEENPTVADTTGNFTFHLDKIVLKDILTTFKDDETGNDVYFYLGNFETNIKNFDLDHFAFHIPKIKIEDITARIYQYKPILVNPDSAIVIAEPSGSSTINPQIVLDELDLNNIDFNYKNDLSAILADLQLGALTSHPENIDVSSMLVQLKDLSLNNTKIKVLMGKTQQAEAVKEVALNTAEAVSSNPWKFQVNQLNLTNNELVFDDENSPATQSGMDFSHLHVSAFMLDADSLVLTPSTYSGNIQQLSLNEKSGFKLEKLKTSFIYNDSGAALNNLLLQTDVTLLKDKLLVTWPSIEAVSKNPGKLFVDANLSNSYIGMKDVLIFLPDFKKNAAAYRNSNFIINIRIKGFVRNLNIPLFEMEGLNNTSVSIAGTIKGLPDPNHTIYDLKINHFQSSREDVLALLPPNTLPNSIRLPNVFSLKGFFKGSMEDFATELSLNTNKGNLFVKGKMQPDEKYSANISTQNLQVGYLLKQEENVGPVSMNATINGKGFDPKKSAIQYEVNVNSALVKGYNYHNLFLTGNVQNGVINAKAQMQDPNLNFTMDAIADINQTYPSINLDLHLDTADLKALHFVSDTSYLSLSGNIFADLQVSNPDSLIGNILLTNLVVNTGKNILTEDSIAIVSNAGDSLKSINIYSDEIMATLQGQYKLTEIAQALQSTINHYYNLPDFKDTAYAPQNWELDAKIIPTGMVLEMMPELKGSDSITIHSSFNSNTNELKLNVENGKLVLEDQQIDNLHLQAQTTAEKLNFEIAVNSIKTPSLTIYKTNLDGYLANNKLNIDAVIRDAEDKKQFAFGGLVDQIPDGIKFSLKSNELLLDYLPWKVQEDNYFQYDSSGLTVYNFEINQGDQSLKINSQTLSPSAPILVEFNNFRIGTITRIANQDSFLLDGIINGNAVVEDVMTDPVFTSDLTINNLIYNTDSLGDLTLKVNNKTENQYEAAITLTGNNNDVRINGNYNTSISEMDMNVLLNQFNLELIQPFAAGQIEDISGLLKGNLSITGSLEQPNIYGEINFENATITPTVSGERFYLPDDKILIDPRGMHFNQFTILDSAKNSLVINGDVLTTDFRNVYFNLDIVGDNFELINTTKQPDQLFYGKLNIDTDIKLGGSIEAPTADAYLRINGLTDFTVILPSENPEIVSREGVVIFVDKDNPKDSAKLQQLADTLVNQMEMKGIEVTANIETDSSAKFTLVIDERNGDALTVKGRADLSAGIDKSGKISLTGNYEITNGSYQVTLSFLKRKFDIQRGSSITWTGDPTSATIDITAVYIAKAASIDLVEQQLSGRPPVEVNRFKEKLPFQVILNMTGELLNPTINFDITLPQDELSKWPVVDTRLQQVRNDQSELNKQVFALLLLNRFVGENPLQSQAESAGLEGAVRESVSQILTDQLNQLAGSLINGVDLNFNLESGRDYSTGRAENRTNLNIGISKKLLNDRITINVGSNFELEGPQNSNRNATNIAGDVSIDYQLSRDGRYSLRAYRKNEYEGVIEGQIIETGLTFMLSYDYDEFKELFVGRKEKKRIRKEKKEARND